ncbi:hypothetical protein TRFO_39894 [Tritrichomonas foetus]|uniref:Rho-GAP domain-containing protein n=1 Tax=Tritrichomonas foetus TaxID=1144522 RepID=A0A1J4J3C6_9EUKA|nr:hypothetical protein TRFO_39894 [Tritrichomonas foetus]|eukprot:OHS93926.1 hypothetical protein TRFO_39894 [Tritrichomonas foetus]
MFKKWTGGHKKDPKTIFKIPINNLQQNESGVPIFFDVTCREISKHFDSQGIFRKCGSEDVVNDLGHKAMKQDFQIPQNVNINDCTSFLKKWLRCLPESILTPSIVRVYYRNSESTTVVLSKIDQINRKCIARIFYIMKEVSSRESVNFMSIQNLLICLMPSFLQSLISDNNNNDFGPNFSFSEFFETSLSIINEDGSDFNLPLSDVDSSEEDKPKTQHRKCPLNVDENSPKDDHDDKKDKKGNKKDKSGTKKEKKDKNSTKKEKKKKKKDHEKDKKIDEKKVDNYDDTKETKKHHEKKSKKHYKDQDKSSDKNHVKKNDKKDEHKNAVRCCPLLPTGKSSTAGKKPSQKHLQNRVNGGFIFVRRNKSDFNSYGDNLGLKNNRNKMAPVRKISSGKLCDSPNEESSSSSFSNHDLSAPLSNPKTESPKIIKIKQKGTDSSDSDSYNSDSSDTDSSDSNSSDTDSSDRNSSTSGNPNEKNDKNDSKSGSESEKSQEIILEAIKKDEQEFANESLSQSSGSSKNGNEKKNSNKSKNDSDSESENENEGDENRIKEVKEQIESSSSDSQSSSSSSDDLKEPEIAQTVVDVNNKKEENSISSESSDDSDSSS